MYKLRTKARENLSERQCKVLLEIIRDLESKQPRDVEFLIWELTVRTQKTAEELGLSTSEEPITEKQCIIVRGDIGNAYKSVHAGWSFGSAQPEDNFQMNLNKALKGDKYVFHMVMKKLKEFSLNTPENIEKAVRCLKSKVETSRFGGLKFLGYYVEEANYLLPAAYAMGEVLEQLTKGMIEEPEKAHKTNFSDYDVPFVYQEPSTNQEKVFSLTPEELIERLLDVKNLLNISFILEADFMEEVIRKKTKIKKFLDALESFKDEEAIWILKNKEKVRALVSAYESLL